MIIVILLNVAMDNNQYSYDLMCKSSTRRPCSIAMLLHSLYIVWNIKLYNTHINILYDNVRHLNSWKPSFIVFIIHINLYPISYSHHLVIGRIYIYIHLDNIAWYTFMYIYIITLIIMRVIVMLFSVIYISLYI